MGAAFRVQNQGKGEEYTIARGWEYPGGSDRDKEPGRYKKSAVREAKIDRSFLKGEVGPGSCDHTTPTTGHH